MSLRETLDRLNKPGAEISGADIEQIFNGIDKLFETPKPKFDLETEKKRVDDLSAKSKAEGLKSFMSNDLTQLAMAGVPDVARRNVDALVKSAFSAGWNTGANAAICDVATNILKRDRR